ncbi:MAG TPA: hypothetical protein DCY13_14890, partial [Verrucomicrobiales bacterium]|nr:hypothetical protein [Verrucomicrobiales bacterium]
MLMMVAWTAIGTELHDGDAWRLRNGRLEVSPDGRHLVHENGKPFLWLGDTAWELFHRLNREEAVDYLEDRRSKGFTVIQAVLLAEMDGLNVPNAYGHLPLIGGDPTRPAVLSGRQNDYWDHVDFILDQAERRGLFVALVPTWGEWVTPRFVKEPVFKTAAQSYRYGNFLGKRYRRNRSLVWILGGDRQPTEMPHAFGVWRALAEGIADGTNNTFREDGQADYSTTLMTYHSMNSSSRWWQKDDWIDFHTWGTYHGSEDWSRSFRIPMLDWSLEPPRPTLNGEPCYEEMPRDYRGDEGFFTATEVRNAAYWSILSGSFGFTYGAHPVWQMWPGQVPTTTVKLPDLAPTRMTWREALSLPGASQMYYLRKMMLARPFEQLRPDQSLLSQLPAEDDSDKGAHVRAARGDRFAWFYSPEGKPIYVQCDRLTTNRINAFWYDPRTGHFLEIGNLAHRPVRLFDPAGDGPGHDWLLLIEDEDAGFDYP